MLQRLPIVEGAVVGNADGSSDPARAPCWVAGPDLFGRTEPDCAALDS
ncbi:hypothetical protein [Streptomyces sp. TS71-3]|nr:hypothetical protein [Streptomyces sp. TS71-3]